MHRWLQAVRRSRDWHPWLCVSCRVVRIRSTQHARRGNAVPEHTFARSTRGSVPTCTYGLRVIADFSLESSLLHQSTAAPDRVDSASNSSSLDSQPRVIRWHMSPLRSSLFLNEVRRRICLLHTESIPKEGSLQPIAQRLRLVVSAYSWNCRTLLCACAIALEYFSNPRSTTARTIPTRARS